MAPSQWDEYQPDPTPEPDQPEQLPIYHPPGHQPGASQSFGPPDGFTEVRPGALVRWIVVSGLVVTLVVGVTVAITVFAGFSTDGPGIGLGGDGDVAAQSPEGFEELLTALEDETGATTVFEATLYPDYAIVDVPYREGDERSVSYRWDGDIDEWTKGTNDETPFDLATIDSSRFGSMCDRARALVEDPQTCYLIVRSPEGSPFDTDAWVWAYTSNEFSQGGYITFDLDGKPVDTVTW